jgi:hypothetical protein
MTPTTKITQCMLSLERIRVRPLGRRTAVLRW